MRTAWLMGLAWLVGCEPIQPQSLHDLEFPADAEVSTTRELRLDLTLDPELAAATPRVVIALPDGRPVFEGHLDADTTHDLRLPPGQDALLVTVQVGDDTVEAHRLSLGSDHALALALEGAP